MSSDPGEPTTALRFHDSEFLTLVQQRWTGNYFWPASLAALGLSVQLNHIKGSCPLPKPGPSNFVVMDVNGFHFVNLQYCGCHLAVPEVEQILRYGWYPGTTTTPHTAISMSCLVHFHLLTLQSKITAYDYYQTVSRLTDNSGIFKSVVGLILTSLTMAHPHPSISPVRIAISSSCELYGNGDTSSC